MFPKLQSSCPSTFKAFAGFQTYLPTGIRVAPKLSSVGRGKKRFTALRSHRTRGTLTSSCLPSNKPNREDLSPKHQHDNGRDETLLTTSEFGFILTSVVTATAGGPALALWGLFFLSLGKYTGTPTWLQAISACIFAGITDALGYNWTSFSFDSGVTPFFVFCFGCGATLLYDSASSSLKSEESHHLSNMNPPKQGPEEVGGAFHGNHDVRPYTSSRRNQLAEWDQAFHEAGGETDGNAK